MNIGHKIMELRKKNNLSQEELAEKVGVTRQTISKWELEETSPDIRQAKELSKIFHISLDELTNNDIQNVIVEKLSNTERLAGIVIKILKAFGIIFIIMVLIVILSFILFQTQHHSDRVVTGKYTMKCTLNDEEYLYEVEYNKDFVPIYSGGDAFITNHIDIKGFENAFEIKAHIEDYFNEHEGSCETTKEE